MSEHTREMRRKRILAIQPNNSGKKYRRHKERGPNITVERVLRAIPGSFGVIARIARRIGVDHLALRRRLKDPSFVEALEAIQDEMEGIVDEAEDTVKYLLRHRRDDHKSALGAAKLVLQTKGKSRGWGAEVTIQGGGSPILHSLVDIDKLNLPLEARRELLSQMEAKLDRKTIRVGRISEE